MKDFWKQTISERVYNKDVVAIAKSHVRMYKQGYDISFNKNNLLHFLLAVYNEVEKELNLPSIAKSIPHYVDSKICRKDFAKLLNTEMKKLEKIEWVAPNLD